MNWKPINLSTALLLKEQFKEINLKLSPYLFSEYLFSNLYLFKSIHQYEIDEDNPLFIKGISRDGFRFLIPTVFLNKEIINLEKKQIQNVDFLFPIPESLLSLFDPAVFTQKFLEEESDYVYLREKFTSFSHTHSNAKKNLLKQFLENLTIETYPITKTYTIDALKILENWQQSQEKEKVETDYFSCREAILSLTELSLSGSIVYVEKKPVGFILGENQGNSNYTIHFTKADKQIKGIYQYLFYQLVTSLDASRKWINLEQDLGIPHLRQSKHSYHPDFMLHKWRVGLIR